jgi:hypothetical protein
MANNLDLDYYDYSNILTTYTDGDGYEFFNLMNSINIEGDIDASLYIYDIADSFSDVYNLSKKYYGTHKLWWIILLVNKIQNPFEINAGQKVKILNNSSVSQILSQINSM